MWKRKAEKNLGKNRTKKYQVINRIFWNKINSLKEMKKKQIHELKDETNRLKTNRKEILKVGHRPYTQNFKIEVTDRRNGVIQVNEEQRRHMSMKQLTEAVDKIKRNK